MPRYVILYHQQPSSKPDLTHWDLMLETEGMLRTWQIHQQPVANQQLQATPLPDHRIDYLQYEGPVSGDRGHVSQWDGGTFEGTVAADGEAFSVELQGRIFCGTLALQPHATQPEYWQVQFSEFTANADQLMHDK